MAYRNYSTAVSHIVDPSGLGDFTTVSAAVNAAVSGDTVFVRPGTYSSPVTLKAGVNITAFPNDSGLVILSIVASFSGSGTVTITGIQLQANSAYALAVTGSSASVVNLYDCYIDCVNHTGIILSSSSASSSISFTNCQGNLATTGIALFTSSSPGAISFNNSGFGNSGGSTTASTISAGSFGCTLTTFTSPITSSGSASVGFGNGSFMSTTAQNVTCLTIGGSGNNTITLSTFGSGTASAISVSSAAQISLCLINCTNTNAVTGAGQTSTTGLNFDGSGQINNVTTQTNTGAMTGIRSGNAPSVGFLGESLRSAVASGSAVSLGTGVGSNVTSIALTPGVWDVSGIVGFVSGATTVPTQFQISISSNSATVAGATGDSDAILNDQTGASLGTSYQPTLTVPSFRVSIASNTTYFLVAKCNFTASTLAAYGRLSATRVG